MTLISGMHFPTNREEPSWDGYSLALDLVRGVEVDDIFDLITD
jgi:hypothetical protein